MKFWFSKKTPKDVYDVKAPYDAAVELALRVAQEVNAAAPDADRDVFDFAKALRPKSEPDLSPELIAPPQELPALATPRPMVSRAAREEMEHRIANYRAFQKKLNDDREARIRRTMDDVRAKLKQSAAPNPTQH
jgi:hypothetical protein